MKNNMFKKSRACMSLCIFYILKNCILNHNIKSGYNSLVNPFPTIHGICLLLCRLLMFFGSLYMYIANNMDPDPTEAV